MRRPIIPYDEKRFASLVESVQDWIWEVDADGVYTYSNHAVEDLLGYKPEEVIGKTPFDFMTPEEAKRVSAEFQSILSEARHFDQIENRNVTKDGRIIFLETSGSPIVDEQGRLCGFRGVDRDITERKEAQTALMEAERFLNGIFDSIQDGVLVLDDDLNVVRVNPAIEKMFPDAPPALGKKCYEALFGRNKICESCPALKTLRTGKPAVEVKLRYGSEGKPAGWYELRSFPLIDPSSGRHTGVIEYHRDISERKRREEELKFRNVLLSNQQEAAIDGVLVVDENDRIVSFNRLFVEMWNIPPDVIEAKSGELALQSILHMLEDPKRFEERTDYLYEHRIEESMEEIRLNDGRTFDRYSAPILDDDGKYYGRVWYYRDITERKNLERQLADFYAMVTHDIKSPLSVVIGYAELILKERSDELDEDLNYMVSSIHKAGVRLHNVVDDLLSLSRMESGKLVINPEPLDVRQLLSEACRNTEDVFRDKGLSFEMDVHAGIPKAFLDRKLLLRAVSNLLQNAANYTPEGGSITLSADTFEDKEGSALSITVRDTGCGIPVEESHKVFEKYYRSTRTTGVKGTGLGLAIVKAVAEAHGGRVELESEVDKGSSFRLILPFEPGINQISNPRSDVGTVTPFPKDNAPPLSGAY